MKTKLILSLALLSLLSFNCIAQSKKTCETPEDTFEELNTISFNKCDLTEKNKKAPTRKVTSNITSKKKNTRIAHYVRKGNKTITKKTIQPTTPKLLFTVVDQAPLFKKCGLSKNKECFNKEFYKHFSENFTPENASDNGINGRVFVQFSINTKGKVSDIIIKGAKKTKKLDLEIKRVINKLPLFKPAIHKGIPVNIKHGLPINLTVS